MSKIPASTDRYSYLLLSVIVFTIIADYFLPYVLHIFFNFLASSALSSSLCNLHFQLMPMVDGVFIRAELSSPKISCIGMIAILATELSASLM